VVLRWQGRQRSDFGLATNQGRLYTVAQSYLHAVSEGDIPNHKRIRKFGYNNVVQNAFEDLWPAGGAYVFPTAAMGMEVVSDSANDAGTVIKSGNADSFTTTTLTDADVDFSTATAVAAGDMILLDGDKAYGYVTTAATNTLTVAYWIGISVPTAGQAYRVVDASSASTGVRVVDIEYLDSSYAENSEFLVTNGTNVVATTATNIIRVQKFHSIFTGSTGAAVGTIDLRHIDNTPVYSRMLPLFNDAQQLIWTVPANYTMYITSWKSSSAAAVAGHYCEHRLRSTSSYGNYQKDTFNMLDISFTTDNSTVMSYPVPPVLPQKTDLKVTVISDGASANALCSGYIDGWYERS